MMASRSGLIVNGQTLLLPPQSSPVDIKDLQLTSHIIKKFENACTDKCFYTKESCTQRCDGEALNSLQRLSQQKPSLPLQQPQYTDQETIEETKELQNILIKYIQHCKFNCRALKQSLFIFAFCWSFSGTFFFLLSFSSLFWIHIFHSHYLLTLPFIASLYYYLNIFLQDAFLDL